VEVHPLGVEDALVFHPRVFPDDRGAFVTTHDGERFTEQLGTPLFPVAQASFSRSRRGVVRGLHYTLTPPGCAKYVWCAHGAVLDIVVDLRVGSPTFGRCDTVELDAERARAVYLPVGVGHGFVALSDDATVTYLMSKSYRPEHELEVSITDPALGLPLPEPDPLLSPRDRAAPTVAVAADRGLLPSYADAVRLDRELRGAAGGAA